MEDQPGTTPLPDWLLGDSKKAQLRPDWWLRQVQICPHCWTEIEPEQEDAPFFSVDENGAGWFRAPCPQCGQDIELVWLPEELPLDEIIYS
jgi:hypothetical protein